jgi:hypothetical protein
MFGSRLNSKGANSLFKRDQSLIRMMEGGQPVPRFGTCRIRPLAISKQATNKNPARWGSRGGAAQSGVGILGKCRGKRLPRIWEEQFHGSKFNNSCRVVIGTYSPTKRPQPDPRAGAVFCSHSQIQNRPLIRGTVFGRQRSGMSADQQRHMTPQSYRPQPMPALGPFLLDKEKPAG